MNAGIKGGVRKFHKLQKIYSYFSSSQLSQQLCDQFGSICTSLQFKWSFLLNSRDREIAAVCEKVIVNIHKRQGKLKLRRIFFLKKIRVINNPAGFVFCLDLLRFNQATPPPPKKKRKKKREHKMTRQFYLLS